MADGEVEIGLRERKKRATRAALSRAAIRLAIERGWSAVTVEEIAAAAGVSERTFRNYFAGKAAAVTALHLDRMVEIADALRARSTDEPLWDAVTEVVVAHFAPPAVEGAHPAAGGQSITGLRLLLDEPALHGELAKASAAAQAVLADAIAQRTDGDARRDLYPNLTAAAIGAAIATAVEHALRTDPPVPLGRVLCDALGQLSAGLPVVEVA